MTPPAPAPAPTNTGFLCGGDLQGRPVSRPRSRPSARARPGLRIHRGASRGDTLSVSSADRTLGWEGGPRKVVAASRMGGHVDGHAAAALLSLRPSWLHWPTPPNRSSTPHAHAQFSSAQVIASPPPSFLPSSRLPPPERTSMLCR